MPLLLFLFLLFSCGGGENKGLSLQLRFSSSEPYYTGVWLRVSGRDFEPVFVQRSGVFYPGDRVVFELEVPPGKERHIEAVILDPEGKPAFYGRSTLDLPAGVVVMDMRESFLRVDLREPFLDGSVPVEGVVFDLFSEDLYSLNYSSSGDLFWVGSYLSFVQEGGRVFHYLEGPGIYGFDYLRLYSFSLPLPQGEEKLELYGSYVGEISKGNTRIDVPSDRLLSGGRPLLVGMGKRLYFYLDGSFKPACELFECKPLRLSISAPELRSYGVFLKPYGLELLAQEGERFVSLRGLGYWLRLEGSVKTPCRMDYSLWVSLGEAFSGEAKVEVKTRRVKILGTYPSALIRIYSENLRMEGSCESSARDGLLIPYGVEEDLWVEARYPEGLAVGALLKRDQEVLSLPAVDLKVDMRLLGSELLVAFERLGFWGWCSLELWEGQKRLYIDRIPPWRSYVRLRNPGYFDKAPEYKLRCEWDEGYVERSSVKAPEVF